MVYRCRLMLAKRELSSFEAVNSCSVKAAASCVSLSNEYCYIAKACHCYSCYCGIKCTLAVCLDLCAQHACICHGHKSAPTLWLCTYQHVPRHLCTYCPLSVSVLADDQIWCRQQQLVQSGAKSHSTPSDSAIYLVSRQMIFVPLLTWVDMYV